MDAYGIFQGGGAKGYAHVGALKAAEDRKIVFTRFGETSAGAIIAALAASGFSADELLDPSKPLGARGVLDIELNALLDPSENKRVERILESAKTTFGWGQEVELEKGHPERPHAFVTIARTLGLAAREFQSILYLRKHFGLVGTRAIIDWLDGLLANKIGCSRPVTFGDLDMRLRMVAANLTTGTIEKFGFVGDEARHVATATMASACFPGFFKPVISKDMFIDGGLLSNLPVWLFDDERDDETSHLPTFGFRLVSGVVDAKDDAPITGLRSFGSKVWSTLTSGGAHLEERRIEYYHPIDLTASINTLSFKEARAKADLIVLEAKNCVEAYFEREIGPQDPGRMNRVLGLIVRELASHFDWTGQRVRAHILVPDRNGRHARTIYSFDMDDSADDHLRVRTDVDGAGAVFRLREPIYAVLDQQRQGVIGALKYELAQRPHWVTGLCAVPIFDDATEWTNNVPSDRRKPFAALVIDKESAFFSEMLDQDEQDLLANIAAIVGEEIRDRRIVREDREKVQAPGPQGWDEVSGSSSLRITARKIRDPGDGLFGRRIGEALSRLNSEIRRAGGTASS